MVCEIRSQNYKSWSSCDVLDPLLRLSPIFFQLIFKRTQQHTYRQPTLDQKSSQIRTCVHCVHQRWFFQSCNHTTVSSSIAAAVHRYCRPKNRLFEKVAASYLVSVFLPCVDFLWFFLTFSTVYTRYICNKDYLTWITIEFVE